MKFPMKAIIWTRYGPPDVLEMREVEKPIPRDDEVLIKVHAASAFAGDCELRRLHIARSVWPFLRLYIGLTRPKRITILGQEMAGEVESVGKNVARFRTGDRVFGISGMKMGTYAEYVCISERRPLSTIPDEMPYEQAAAVSAGGFEALHFLRKANVKRGQSVLINGAGGSIGTMALQLVKMTGAEATCVDAGSKLDMLKELGADHVIDYSKEDFADLKERYDVIFDVVGKMPYVRGMRSLKEDGTLILGNSGFIVPKIYGLLASLTGRGRVLSNLADGTTSELEELKGLTSSGKVKVVIDRCFPLEHAADAHRYVESGEKKGNVVIIMR